MKMWAARVALAALVVAALVTMALVHPYFRSPMWWGGHRPSLLWWLVQFFASFALGVALVVAIVRGVWELLKAAFPE